MKKFFTLFAALLALSVGTAYVSVSCAATPHKRLPQQQKHTVAVVNINKADVKAMQTLNGIGEKKAQAIVKYREQNGKFKSLNDLAKVKGIGSKFLAKLEAKNKGKIRFN